MSGRIFFLSTQRMLRCWKRQPREVVAASSPEKIKLKVGLGREQHDLVPDLAVGNPACRKWLELVDLWDFYNPSHSVIIWSFSLTGLRITCWAYILFIPPHFLHLYAQWVFGISSATAVHCREFLPLPLHGQARNKHNKITKKKKKKKKNNLEITQIQCIQ